MSSATQSLAVPREGLAALARDYSVLIKARITTLIVMTAWAGAYFAAAKSGASLLSWTLLHALIGIGLVSGGTAAINEVVERDLDALMRRTSGRPLVTGRVRPLPFFFNGLGSCSRPSFCMRSSATRQLIAWSCPPPLSQPNPDTPAGRAAPGSRPADGAIAPGCGPDPLR